MSNINFNEDQKTQALEDIVGSDNNQVVTMNHIPDTSTAITVNIVRHYGQISIELGATIQAVVNRPEDFNVAYSDLFDHVTEQHRLLAAKLTNGTKSPAAAAPAAAASANGYSETDNVIPVDSIFMEKKGGKTYYSIKGGKFAKFGVRLWLDDKVIGSVKDEIQFQKLNEGDNKPPVPMKAEVEFENGKPKRISRVFLVMQQDEIPF